jgi:hypothetical protein
MKAGVRFVIELYAMSACLLLMNEDVQAENFEISANVLTVHEGQESLFFPNFIRLQNDKADNTSKYVVKPVRYRVPVSSPTWLASVNSNDTGGLFRQMPFIDPKLLSLNFSLAPMRNGFVRFSVYSHDGSQLNFSILVKEINQPPSFQLNPKFQFPLRLAVGSKNEFSNFAINISKGGWGEDEQSLFFTWQQNPPIHPIVQRIDFLFIPDSSTMTLKIHAANDAWGNATFNLSLHDSQGAVQTRTIAIRTDLEDLSSFVHYAIDLPCDIELGTSVCRQGINVLANSACDGNYTWTDRIERQHTTIYSTLPKVEKFPLGVLSCEKESARTGEYKLRDFVHTAAGRLSDLRRQDLTQAFKFIMSTDKDTFLFDVLPTISDVGTLYFRINGSAPNGIVTFNLTTSCQGAHPFTIPLTFKIWQGRFQIRASVAAFQGIVSNFANGVIDSVVRGQACVLLPDCVGVRFYAAENRSGVPRCDNTGVCRCQSSDGRDTTFETNVEVSSALSFVNMDWNGSLTFAISDGWFGNTYINVTLVSWSQPETRTFLLSVLHQDEPPSFTAQNVSVVHSSGCRNASARKSAAASCSYNLSSVFSDVRAGGLSESCSNCPGEVSCQGVTCQAQTLSFVLESVSNPALFASLPIASIDGTLSFALWPEAKGETVVHLRLLDDGAQAFYSSFFSLIIMPENQTTSGFVDPQRAGMNSSALLSFQILISTEDDLPYFSLARQVQCTESLLLPCTCPVDYEALLETPSCKFSDEPGIRVLENSGEHLISSFVTDISASQSVANGMTTFELDSNGSISNFSTSRREPLAGSPDLSLAVSFAVSPGKQNHVYAAEFESNTLAILSRDGRDFNLTLKSRRAEGESRFRFVHQPEFDFETQNPCYTEMIKDQQSKNITLAVMQGCGRLEDNYEFLPSFFPGDSANVANKIADPHQEQTSGYWSFNSYFANGKLQIATSDLKSGSSTPCQDKFDTNIDPAGFSDSTGTFPDAVLLYIPPDLTLANQPPLQCKTRTFPKKYKLYQDSTIGTQPSVLTYLANNGIVEALQFDRRNVGGNT